METSEHPQYPIPGHGVMIIKDGKVLCGKRKSSHGAGEYSFPGGKLEWGESFEESLRREVREETGLEIQNIKFLRLLNFKSYGKHFIDVTFSAEWASGEPRVMEPEKCESWDWYPLDALPEPLFAGCASTLEAYKTGKNFFDN